MNLDLTPPQLQLQARCREFAQGMVMPRAAYWDRQASFPWDVYQAGHEAGLINKYVPVAYGGAGSSLLDGCIANEELGFGCTGISTAITINDLGLLPLLLAGSEEQKQRFLPQITGERLLVSFCVTEPDAGSDVAAMQTRARLEGDHWVINGTKKWITAGPYAHYFIVFAVTAPAQKHKGISCFVVPGDLPGITRGPSLAKMGQKAAPACLLHFTDVAVPASCMLGQPGDGFLIIMQTFDFSRPSLSAQAVGLARRALEEAVQYAGERQAFGQSISRFQGVGFLLSEMAIRTEAARWLTRHAAWQTDQGRSNTREAAMCKAYAGDAAMINATEAVQVFGGNGYSEEFPVEKLMRDAKIFQIYEGTTQIQKLIILRDLYQS